MPLFDDLEELKRKVDRLRSRKEQATGALNQVLQRIKEEFGCRNLIEAEHKLKELEEQEREAAKTYSKAKKRFEETHKEILESLE